MLNKCIFQGRLTRDPELRDAGQSKVCQFDIALNRTYKKNDQVVNEPSFIACEAWATGAELIAKHFKKGDPIIVEASVKTDTWEDKATGQKRSKLKFRVNEFHFVGNKKDNGGGGPAADDTPAQEYADAGVGNADGEIPF